MVPRRWSLVPVMAACLALGPCGDGTDVQVSAAVQTVTVTQPPPPVAATPRPPRRYRDCDGRVRARKRTTSCGFARNVFYAYWRAQQAGEDAVTAFSPATGTAFDVTCRDATMVVCRAGDGAEIRFPMAAVDAYGPAQAQDYCFAHDTTGDGVGAGCDDTGDEPPPTDEACDSNYAGACLDPNSADYDCAGGSGDGPDYTGEVKVVGSDPYDLDRDGDGIACDT